MSDTDPNIWAALARKFEPPRCGCGSTYDVRFDRPSGTWVCQSCYVKLPAVKPEEKQP